MQGGNRKSTPRVIKGKVQKKNSWSESENYYHTPQRMPVIDRKRPGAGYRHLLRKKDIEAFIALLPDWPELSRGLNAIVLAPGDWDLDGYHVPGVVHVCAWKSKLWRTIENSFYEEQCAFLERLGVPCEALPEEEGGGTLCKFTEDTARAYQLLDVLLHELGHHHDRMTTRSKKRASRGEKYAEAYALKYEAQIWEQYLKTFELY